MKETEETLKVETEYKEVELPKTDFHKPKRKNIIEDELTKFNWGGNLPELTNTTYENGLISILLNSDIDTIIEVASVLTVEDFSSQNILAAGLYAIIKKLINDDREINPVNIVAEAEKISKILNALGGKEKAFETIVFLLK